MFLHKMGQRGTWEDPGGPTMPTHHVWAQPAPWSRLGMVRGPLALHSLSHLPQHPLSRQNSSTLFKPMFLLFFLAIFNLLAQPIFDAEILGNCSPVCDSSVDPSRILFDGVFLEYFGTVGGRLCELAFLFYA